MSDYSSIGAAHYAEAHKAKHRLLAIALLLIISHLLDIRPAEGEFGGLKIPFNDPIVIYSGLSLIFGYYFSKFLSESLNAQILLPVRANRRKIRHALYVAWQLRMLSKEDRGKPVEPRKLKSNARFSLIFDNLILFPYRCTAALIVIFALLYMIDDFHGFIIYFSKNIEMQQRIPGALKFILEFAD